MVLARFPMVLARVSMVYIDRFSIVLPGFPMVLARDSIVLYR